MRTSINVRCSRRENGEWKRCDARSQLAYGNIEQYYKVNSTKEEPPSARKYCLTSGSMSDINDELNNNTDKKLYVLRLPVFAEYNVEIFNGKRAFIDRLSWLENTIKFCQILKRSTM